MSVLKTLDASVISLVILIIVFIHSYSKFERIFIQYRLFSALLVLNMVFIVVDFLGRVFNGLPGTLNMSLNIAFNSVLYCIVPAAPSLWVLYTYYFIPGDERKIRRIRLVLLVFMVINMLFTVISLFTGWLFFVDKDNMYHRGPLFFLFMTYCGLFLLYSLVIFCLKRKTFQRRQFFWILLFYVPQIAGSTLQTFIYGSSYNWTGMMVSMLIIYFNFQLVDIDAFKKINDELGHTAGDKALIDAAGLLRESLRRDDFIARFGGDEFIAIIDTQTTEDLETAVERINKNVNNFNQAGDKPYKLSFSLGYEVYDVKSGLKADEFIDRIDRLMYKNKRPEISGS